MNRRDFTKRGLLGVLLLPFITLKAKATLIWKKTQLFSIHREGFEFFFYTEPLWLGEDSQKRHKNGTMVLGVEVKGKKGWYCIGLLVDKKENLRDYANKIVNGFGITRFIKKEKQNAS